MKARRFLADRFYGTVPHLRLGRALLVGMIGLTLSAQATVRTWTGAGADALASTPQNWSDSTAPVAGDSVVFDDTHLGNAQTNVNWDLNIVLAAWTQTADYGGIITILTKYPGEGTFTNLVVTGNVTLEGGVWRHLPNTGLDVAVDRLAVSVEGDFTLGSGAEINLALCGFAAARGPGKGISDQDDGSGASHGGMGGYHYDRLPAPMYGSITQPETLGSGVSVAGGGALFMVVGGQAVINGLIQADGGNSSRRAGTAGGSIFLRAASVSGVGTLRADGGPGESRSPYSGGGGRVALIATHSATLGDVVTFARSGDSSLDGTAGSVFRKTTAGTQLIIDQDNRTPQSEILRPYPQPSRYHVETELPAASAEFDLPLALGGDMEDAVLRIDNQAVVKLTSDMRLGNFAWLDATLDLNGYTLFLKAAAPAGYFPADYGGGAILTNDGRIVWGDAAATVKLDVYAYNSSVAPSPASPTSDGYYALGTDVTLSVTPDSGYTFLWWKGDLPEGVDRTTHPLTVTMDGRRNLIPVVGGTVNTHTWIGEGANRLASNPANWYPATAPVSGQHIVFDAASDVECYWDLDIEPASWTQTSDYRAFYSGVAHSGFVWLHTRYPDQGTFTNLAIWGDCLLDGGTWTHPANTGVDVQRERLAVCVHGDFRLGSQASINVANRGFDSSRGPGAGVTGQRKSYARGGSHGGLGNYILGGVVAGQTYGSITAPTALGSGSAGRGGGAVLVQVDGQLTLDGDILAFSDRGINEPTLNPGAAGGSIYLRGASVTGAGNLSVKGALGYQCGGGGRIALILTNSTDFGDVTLEASGASHNSGSLNSSAGTIYLEGWDAGAPSLRRLVVDNEDVVSPEHIFVELMPSYETYDPVPAVGGEIEDAALEIRNRGRVQLTSSLTMGDFDWIETASTLDLNAYTYYLKADEPAGAFPGDYGGGTILTNEGAIVWGESTVELSLVTTAGPNGAVVRNPDSLDDLFEYQTSVMLTANPDPDHTFIYWEGDIPEGSNRTSNPLTVVVDQARTLRALFASTVPDTSTWTGDGEDVQASNPLNWYPNVAPTSGAHIVLDSTSVKELHWDLDVELASWTQTAGYEAYYTPAEGYRGWVVIETKFPGMGAFTNLVITGDVTLEGGTWTQPVNTGVNDAVDRMWVTIGGDLSFGTNAMIDVRARGFDSSRGPGAGNTQQRVIATGSGGSHGGRAAFGPDVIPPPPCYGSMTGPEHLGSGASGRGGGAVRLDVAGHSRIDGMIDARGKNATDLQPGPAGGSIWLTTGTFAGEGLLDASGDVGYQAGGGGRIAVHLGESEDFGDVVMLAVGGNSATGRHGAPGTIVKLGATGRGELLVDNNNHVTPSTEYYTEIPATLDGEILPLRDLRLRMRNAARVGIQADNMRVLDVTEIDASSRLHLQGYTLYVRTPYHVFSDGDEAEVVVEGGGELVWPMAGTMLLLR